MIWCVEDDASIREIEVYALRSTGFEALGFEDGLACWQALKTQKPELIVLDVMLPELDGAQLLQKIRNTPALADIPILMATAKGAEFDKIRLLDLGADDYLVKPFGMMEMVSRIKAILRRCKKPVQVLRFGSLVLNFNEHTVTLDGVRVMLTFKEYELLRLFLSNLGSAFTREELLAKIWDTDFLGQTRTVDMHIRTLRQKIGRYGACIETVRNVGYRMGAEYET